MNLELGDYAAPQELFRTLIANVPWGAPVLELGSGSGTALLAKFFDVVTVEHDESFVGRVQGARYVHAPLAPHDNPDFPRHARWYDPDALREGLAGFEPRVILVDGPPGNVGRSGVLTHSELFDFERTLLVLDDLHRMDEYLIYLRFVQRLPNHFSAIVPCEGGRRFGVLFDPRALPFPVQVPV